MKIINSLQKHFPSFFGTKNIISDVYCLSLLEPLIKDLSIDLTFTNSSLQPSVIRHILNEISINKRNCVVELGSGISTILIAKYIKNFNLETVFYSIEEDDKWLSYLAKTLQTEGLDSHVCLIQANTIKANKFWYDPAQLDKKLSNANIDCLIIDGPKAYENPFKDSRRGAIDYFKDKMNKNCCLFIDDALRKKEKDQTKEWSKIFNLPIRRIGTYAYAARGQYFNTIPI